MEQLLQDRAPVGRIPIPPLTLAEIKRYAVVFDVCWLKSKDVRLTQLRLMAQIARSAVVRASFQYHATDACRFVDYISCVFCQALRITTTYL